MRRIERMVIIVWAIAGSAFAQEERNGIAPLPLLDRISPEGSVSSSASEMLSTKPITDRGEAEILAPLPTPTSVKEDTEAVEKSTEIQPLSQPVQPTPPPTAAPFGRINGAARAPGTGNAMAPGTPAAAGAAKLPAKIPFGRAMAEPSLPLGPHTAIAMPVANVDAVEVSAPVAATPAPLEADPVTEDEAAPTEFSSPIFDASDDVSLPRKALLRVMNKVTAQSALFKVKPGDTVLFGKLKISVQQCRISNPKSQKDSAALLDIHEHTLTTSLPKTLFRGWMYASSPSITGLEHPIYDVTMVGCEVAAPPPVAEKLEKDVPKSEKKRK